MRRLRTIGLMRVCKCRQRLWNREDEDVGSEGGDRGGRGKPFGIMRPIYTEHLRPAGFVSHYWNSPVRWMPRGRLFTN